MDAVYIKISDIGLDKYQDKQGEFDKENNVYAQN